MSKQVFEWIKEPYAIDIDSPFGSYETENGVHIISTRKNIRDLNIDELKEAYRVRLIENNKHPNSAFKPAIDEEMILLTNYIKRKK